MNRLFDSQINKSRLTEDSWKILEPAIRDIVRRMFRRDKASSLRERTSTTPHLTQNQLVEDTCDRIRGLLVSGIADFETNSNQSTKTVRRRRQLTAGAKEHLSDEAKKVAESLRAALSYLEMTPEQLADAIDGDRECIQRGINTGEIGFYEILDVIELVGERKTNDSRRIVERLLYTYDADHPSIFLLGAHCSY